MGSIFRNQASVPKPSTEAAFYFFSKLQVATEAPRGANRAPSSMKVEVVSSETIKPSSPTPLHIKNFTLSLCDQLSPALFVPLILYFPDVRDSPTNLTSADKIRRLKSSLSLLLARFYPFAGRIKDNLTIDCNDDGASFLEAKVDCQLSEVLTHPDLIELRMLIPIQMESAEASRVYPFQVQVNLFDCGGLALGISISHKIADATTLTNFITSWANIAIDPEGFTEHPRLDASAFFPPSTHLADLPVGDLPVHKCMTRRFVFESSKIMELVESAKSERVVQPTRVEAVSALVWWCTTRASGKCFGITGKRSMLSQAVNLRPRTSPPIANSTVGNLVTLFVTEMDEDVKGEVSGFLRELTAKLRAKKDEFLENMVKKKMVRETASATFMGSVKTIGGLLHSEEVEFYPCSSWFGLSMYEADFGWGKPIWTSTVNSCYKNTVVLMKGRGGEGMEAWVTLLEDHMGELERDEELLRFAAVNPTISW